MLCSAGYSATLNLKSNNGRASVTLRADIGIVSPPIVKSSSKGSYRSSAYTRRAEQRQLSRQVVVPSTSGQAEEVNHEIVCNETENPLVVNENVIQANDFIDASKPENATETVVATKSSMGGEQVLSQEDKCQK